MTAGSKASPGNGRTSDNVPLNHGPSHYNTNLGTILSATTYQYLGVLP